MSAQATVDTFDDSEGRPCPRTGSPFVASRKPHPVPHPSPAPTRSRSVRVGYARVDCVSFRDAVERICVLAESDRWSQLVVTPNIQHVVELDRNPAFRQAYDGASLVVPDGWPVVAAQRWAGAAQKERVTGADLLPAVCEAAVERGLTVGFMGGRPGAAALCADRLRARFPGLQVSFVDAAPIGFDSDERTLRELLDRLADARPNILFVGLGAPKQEIFADRYRPRTNVVLGIGAAIDFNAGLLQRASKGFQRCGMEWLYRIAHEPRRLIARYAKCAPKFAWIVARTTARSSFGGNGGIRSKADRLDRAIPGDRPLPGTEAA